MHTVSLEVEDLREQYTREMALVRQTCERTGDGTAAIRRRSAVVDRILIEMWRRAFADLPIQNVALLALGGYGRKDLFPYSDIDVLFTFADERTEEQSREAVRAIIQGMWDIGLRASPSSRTVKEAGKFDPDNLEFTLATLDRRFLAGQFPLYQQLHQVVFPGLVLSEWTTITQKLNEIARTRHAKMVATWFGAIGLICATIFVGIYFKFLATSDATLVGLLPLIFPLVVVPFAILSVLLRFIHPKSPQDGVVAGDTISSSSRLSSDTNSEFLIRGAGNAAAAAWVIKYKNVAGAEITSGSKPSFEIALAEARNLRDRRGAKILELIGLPAQEAGVQDI